MPSVEFTASYIAQSLHSSYGYFAIMYHTVRSLVSGRGPIWKKTSKTCRRTRSKFDFVRQHFGVRWISCLEVSRVWLKQRFNQCFTCCIGDDHQNTAPCTADHRQTCPTVTCGFMQAPLSRIQVRSFNALLLNLNYTTPSLSIFLPTTCKIILFTDHFHEVVLSLFGVSDNSTPDSR